MLETLRVSQLCLTENSVDFRGRNKEKHHLFIFLINTYLVPPVCKADHQLVAGYTVVNSKYGLCPDRALSLVKKIVNNNNNKVSNSATREEKRGLWKRRRGCTPMEVSRVRRCCLNEEGGRS